jgi:signal transduction histidine kinase
MRLTEVVEDVLRLNASSLQRGDVRIVRRFEADPELVSDRHMIMQVIVNLLSNARHALADAAVPEPTIEIATRLTAADSIALDVMDNGVGISAENLRHIFEHGFTTRRTGHGFGLHASAKAAQELGGRLAVDSAGAGRGATFTLEMPLSGARMAREVEVSAAASAT